MYDLTFRSILSVVNLTSVCEDNNDRRYCEPDHRHPTSEVHYLTNHKTIILHPYLSTVQYQNPTSINQKSKILLGNINRTQLLNQKLNKVGIFLMMILGQIQYRLSLAKVSSCIDTYAILDEQSYHFDMTLACCLFDKWKRSGKTR